MAGGGDGAIYSAVETLRQQGALLLISFMEDHNVHNVHDVNDDHDFSDSDHCQPISVTNSCC